jgi:CheY-like chemotaxis protein/two-component sensor histidine kinase
VREALDEAADGARRVQEIAGDLRAFSRADDTSRAPVDLARVVQGALALAANELRHRARTTVDVAGAPPVLANESRVGQILLNLVVNAAHAIPEGDAARNEVRIEARREGNLVAVEVSDTGTGVPPEIRARIFDPFFTTKPVGEGTGLGLWVCRRIAAALGGTVELAPSPGRGATFRLLLPSAEGVVAAAPPPSAPAPAAPRRPRLLVVDDEPLVGRALRRALREDADVEVEESGAAALARIRRGERFDLVLSDVMMPQMPGADFHAALERIDPALARAMVFMTGGAFSAREREFLARIPNPCLDKPLDLARLRALVRGRGA